MVTIGEKIGHYKLNSAIGAGGMGEIYLARDSRLRRDVAIKILPENLTQNQIAVERFMREAYSASALNHPNILTIYDIGKSDETHFIATEFVEGKTLRFPISEMSLNLLDSLDIAIQIANALVAAHSAGIVHRDIKPENIMLRSDGYVKVLDFGLAKLTEEKSAKLDDAERLLQIKTNPGMVLGTANYMSPEQSRGLEVDTRSDIFSLGVVLYEMVAGCVPFSGETVSDVIAAILRAEPKPLSHFVKHIPLELEWSVSKALNKSREDRYQTVKGFLGDLKRLKQRLEFENELKRVGDSGNKNFSSGETEFSERATARFSRDELQINQPTLILPNENKTQKLYQSLAVLPLINVSSDANNEYLSDGITESIINCLSSIPTLRVVPRSTVFRFKGSETEPQEIGKELGVCAVFAGRVLQHGNSLIVKTELIDIENESQIWGEQYRREMTDIFTLQEEIAEDISEQLRLKLAVEEKKLLRKNYTENTEAYQLYLKGRYFVTTKRTEEWIKKGIAHFQEAIDLDPNYALAYSGIAEAYGLLASSTGGWLPEKAYPKAKAAAQKALELDETLGEAHCSLGFFRLLYDWNFAEAEREFKRAVELSPNHPNAHDGYGFYLKAVGRLGEAIEKCKKLQELDPLFPFAYVSLGYAYYFARDYENAIEECNKALELDAFSTFAYRNLGLAYLQQKKYDSAISALSKAVTFSSGGLAFESYLGFAYARAGKKSDALEVLANLEELAKERYVPAYNFAMIYLGLNDFDKSFEYLEAAFKERSGFLPFLKVEPLVDDLRNDLRFQDMVKRIGLQ
jgi:serine/threonine protein kinase/tetratricopeptide (TPR) repeat protein